MMETVFPLLLAFLGWGLGGFVVRVTGLGGGIIAMPLLVAAFGTASAVPVSSVAGLLAQLYLSLHLYKSLQWRDLLWPAVWTLPGGAVGLWLYATVNVAMLTIALALMMLLSVGLTSFHARQSIRRTGCSSSVMAILCLLMGITQASVGVGGPWVGLYTVLQGWDKDRLRCFLAFIFCPIIGYSTISYYCKGYYDSIGPAPVMAVILGIVVGMAVGNVCDRKINHALCHKLILLLTWLAGISLLVQGLRML